MGLGAPNVNLSYACAGYYVSDANVFQIAILQKSPVMLQHLIANTINGCKSNALWHAVRANKTDYVQPLLIQVLTKISKMNMVKMVLNTLVIPC